MKKMLLLLTLLNCTICLAEVTNEDIDKKMRHIVLRKLHIGDMSREEMIRLYQKKECISNSKIESSLCRMLETDEKNEFLKQIILGRAINCLGDLGNKDSILQIEKLIDDSNPLGEVSREAMFNCIILSNYEFQRIEKYINICVDRNEKFWINSLFNTFLYNYNNENEIELKGKLEDVIKKAITLLENHNYSYWIKELLDKQNLGAKFNVVSKRSKSPGKNDSKNDISTNDINKKPEQSRRKKTNVDELAEVKETENNGDLLVYVTAFLLILAGTLIFYCKKKIK